MQLLFDTYHLWVLFLCHKKKHLISCALALIISNSLAYSVAASASPLKIEDIQAFETLMTVAKIGNGPAERIIASMYEHGEGVEKDIQQAVYWYMKAAKHQDDIAQFYVGYLYYQAIGLKQDYKKAFHWFAKAAEQGNPDFQYNLGNLYRYGEGVDKDFNTAFKWYLKAAEQDQSNAQYDLGNLFLKGDELEKDLISAYFWFELANEELEPTSLMLSTQKLMSKGELEAAQKKVKHWIIEKRPE